MHSSTPYHPHGAPIFPIRQTQQLFPEETSCCVKKKHARQTTARPYIQSVRSSTSRSFFTPYSQTQHNLSPPRSQKPKTSSRRANRIQNPRPPRAVQPESRTQDLLAPRNQNPEPKTSSCRATRIQNPRPPRTAQPESRTQDLLAPRNQNPEPKTSWCRAIRIQNPERSRLWSFGGGVQLHRVAV